MSRAEAASRLGMPMEECAECDVTIFRDDALMVVPNSEMPPTNVSGGHVACSLRCVVDSTYGTNGFIRCYRWKLRDKTWTEIGARPHLPLKGWGQGDWEWNDTGEARWLEENAARLRAAGEIV